MPRYRRLRQLGEAQRIPIQLHVAGGSKKRSTRKEPPAIPGDVRSPRGQRIRYEEVPFEPGSPAHSRFVQGVVQANTLNGDYMEAAKGVESRLTYAALMIGKESIAFNDRSGAAGDFLEKLLDFFFKLQARSRKKRARRRSADAETATQLAISD